MAVPQGAFAAFKIRENEEKMKQPHMEDEDRQIFSKHYPALNPHHYNSKLMNSIWGMYNRYSVHNFKKNMDAAGNQLFLNQYSQGVGSFSSADKVSADLGGGKSSRHVAKKLLGAPDSTGEIKKKYMYA